jgi:cytochrome oxidase Cu insertion factor (SCO1/SenC/PrrC family)
LTKPVEPLGLTVHATPVPDVQAVRKRTLSGRLKMLLILLACAAPVIASYFTYYVIRPEGRSNYGSLVQPPRPLPAALDLRELDGRAVTVDSLRGQWLLLVVGSGACDSTCEKLLYMQRQLREMLGRERDRVDKVWLVLDALTPPTRVQEAIASGDAVRVLRASAVAVSGWLTPEPGQSMDAHLYLVDPMGQWMMRFPAQAEPSRVKRDLERLLRASSSWDRAGR